MKNMRNNQVHNSVQIFLIAVLLNDFYMSVHVPKGQVTNNPCEKK